MSNVVEVTSLPGNPSNGEVSLLGSPVGTLGPQLLATKTVATQPVSDNSLAIANTAYVEEYAPLSPATIAFAASLAVVGDKNKKLRVAATGALAIPLPSAGVDGVEIEYWITASGGSRVVTLNAAIVIPATITFSNPVTIASGKKGILVIGYDATLAQWEMRSYQADY